MVSILVFTTLQLHVSRQHHFVASYAANYLQGGIHADTDGSEESSDGDGAAWCGVGASGGTTVVHAVGAVGAHEGEADGVVGARVAGKDRGVGAEDDVGALEPVRIWEC